MAPLPVSDRLAPVRQSWRRITHLAWPVLVGQLAVLAFSTIDTLLLARVGSADLAALAVGAAAYITVFVGLMGVLLAIGPIVGHWVGAGQTEKAGRQFQQAMWLALLLAVPGCAVLAWPTPFLWWSKAEGAVAQGISDYLQTLAFALPAALVFTVFRGFNTAISRPKAVMVVQVLGLCAKLPLSAALAWGVPALGVEGMGVRGCAIATTAVMWLQCAVSVLLMLRDPAYAPYAIWGRGWDAPRWADQWALLRLGVPMGAGILVEVTGFTFMAIFIARLGPTQVAGHQIVANLVAILFMVPLALSNATSTLVAQRLGAVDLADARALSWHGTALAGVLALLMGAGLYVFRETVVGWYTRDAAVALVATGLMAWVAWFHWADALQTMAALVLRAYRVATLPVVVYALALWGVGLGGGYCLAFGTLAEWGARGFWLAATVALWLAAAALLSLMAWVIRRRSQELALHH